MNNNTSIQNPAARPVYTYLSGPAATTCRSAIKAVLVQGLESGLSHKDLLQLLVEEYSRIFPPMAAVLIVNHLETIVALLSEEGGVLSLKEAVTLLGKNERERKRWSDRITSGEIVSFQTISGHWFVPRWQFSSKRTLLPGIAEVVKILRSKPEFEAVSPFLFFLQANPKIQGKTPLSCLRDGKVLEVVCAART
jgi:hypothetical protein